MQQKTLSTADMMPRLAAGSKKNRGGLTGGRPDLRSTAGQQLENALLAKGPDAAIGGRMEIMEPRDGFQEHL